jgi:hypothetical protein
MTTIKRVFLIGIACSILWSCAKDSDYKINDGLSPDDIIKISSISNLTPYADSSTEVLIRIEINKYSSSNQPVTLTTTQGIINNASKSETVTTNTDRYVDFKLKTSQTAGPVLLKATVLTDYSRDTIINFQKAYPDSIVIDPEKYIIDKNTTLSLDVNLFRYEGYPSLGQNIFYSAVSDNGMKAGTVTTSDSFTPGSIIKVTFTPNTDYVGDALIVVKVLKEDGSKKESEVKITIK